MKPTILTAAVLALLVALVAPATAHAGMWTWPVPGEVITPYRNGDDPYAAGQHRGVDIAAAVGERVVAASAGTVTFAGVAGSSGLTVSVRTAGGRFGVSYLHLSEVAVREGDAVLAGDALGAVGTSGRRSAERPHLHFGVREAGDRHEYRDPLDFLGSPPPRGEPREPAPAPAPSGAPAEPRGAPAVGAPVPAGAPPRPAGEPDAGRAPARSPGRAPTPAGRTLPLPGAGPRTLLDRPFEPGPPAAAAARSAGPAGAGPAPAGGARRAAAASSPPQGTAPAAAGRGPEPADPSPVAHAGPATPRAGGHHAGGGIDAGWLAACAGLLLVATALGRSATAPRSGRGAGVVARRPRSPSGRLSARGADL